MLHRPPGRCPPGRRLACWVLPSGCERLLAALRASLAEETLRALDADVRALIPTMTWAQLAEILRVTRSAAWRRGLLVPATAVPHQMLWLLAGGDAPSPRQLPGGLSNDLGLPQAIDDLFSFFVAKVVY